MARSGEINQKSAPRRVAGVRIAELPLSPEDAFIWSQLDGHTRPTEVSELTGMPEAAVRDTLARLEQLGAVSYGDTNGGGQRSGSQRRDPRRDETEPPPPPPDHVVTATSRRDPRRDPTQPPPAQMSSVPSASSARAPTPDPRRDQTLPPAAPNTDAATVKPGRRAAPTKSASARPQAAPTPSLTPAPTPAPTSRAESDPATVPLTEASSPPVSEVALTETQRQRIDEMFEQLDVSTHYGLLGVASDADKKAIKTAYFELIAFFHPDKFFRKELGDYRRKLEKIFQRLTEANEVLTRRGPRAEYDKYLEARQKTRALDAVMTSIPPPPPRSVVPPTPDSAIALDLPPLSADQAASTSQSGAAQAASAPPRSEASPEERSQALARRLAAGKAMGGTRSHPAPTAGATLDEAAVAEQLRRLVQARRSPQVSKFVQAGKDALAESAWVSAVNALRIALSLAPDDDEIRALYEEADQKAAEKLADSYESRARYEEKSGDHDAAAQSWERVASARKEDDKPLRRAAECYASTSQPKRGIAPGRAAVQLAPSVRNRTVLAKVYEVCGMIASAMAEANRALEQKPDDAELIAMLARLQPSK